MTVDSPAFVSIPERLPHHAALRWLAARVAAERERWLLWLPVAAGAGIAGYFALPSEPHAWLGWAALGGAIALGVLGRRTLALLPLALLLGATAAGFVAAQVRSHSVAAPVPTRPLDGVWLTATVVEVEPRGTAVRLLLAAPEISRLDPDATPARVRVTLRGKTRPAPGDVVAGDRVRLRARLAPPGPPAAPGAFDFRRHAWFARLGATGFGYTQPRVIEGADSGGLVAAVARLRQSIFERVTERLPGAAGGVAAALMVGQRGAVPPDVMDAMRDSGLAHLLAISGLHVGLVAGLVFFFVRGGLALVPAVALRRPIKKWAALCAIAGAFAYLLLAGATVPTQRAFVMTGLVLLAVLLDRTALTMRLVAWAALALLLLRPESLLGASFQMSFAAVVALVAAYEALNEPLRRWQTGPGRRLALYVAAVAFTSLIAGLATGPFALYHFNRVVSYGLIANMAAVPLTALWVMPWGLLAFVLMPLGLEGVALAPMGWGLDGVIWVARTVAGWPHAVHLVPAMPPAALAAVALSGLWLCLWRRPWRLLGLVGIAGGLVATALARPPDLLISADARLMGIHADGVLTLNDVRAKGLVRETWLRRLGADTVGGLPRDGPTPDGRLACDALGCLYRAKGHTVALVRDPRALDEDCAVAGVLLSAVPARRGCRGPAVRIDRFDVWRHGAHAVWLGETVRVARVRDAGDRPWAPAPKSRRAAQ